MRAVWMPEWRFEYEEMEYYGWRHSFQIGPWLFMWGRMNG